MADDEQGNGRVVNPNIQRISLSLGATTRRNIRIAAAVEDVTVGEWCERVLNRAAELAIPDEMKATMKRKARAKRAR